jgi:hypothetical protein
VVKPRYQVPGVGYPIYKWVNWLVVWNIFMTVHLYCICPLILGIVAPTDVHIVYIVQRGRYTTNQLKVVGRQPVTRLDDSSSMLQENGFWPTSLRVVATGSPDIEK